MIISEKDAHTKWCPMTRVLATDAKGKAGDLPAGNRLADPSDNRGRPIGFCIGAQCMMWRQHREPFVGEGDMPPAVEGGYCGLAGEP